MKNKLLLALSVLLMACNSSPEDPEPEDYDALFPFTGIDKPEISYEDMTHQQCDISNYVYPGVDTQDDARKYTVTLTCKYTKEDSNSPTPYYFVKYVGIDKQLKAIGTNPNTPDLEEILEEGKEKTITFTLPAGYPMYLSVSGKGDRGTRIEAVVNAVSTDGVVVVPELTYAISQNGVGIDQVVPYCQYIVLP